MTRKMPHRTRPRKMVFHKISNTVGPPLQPIAATTFTVNAGTEAWRLAEGTRPDKFITTRKVVFDTSDVMKEYAAVGGITTAYTFKLPPEAAPWNQLEVNVADILFGDEDGQQWRQ